MVESSEGNRRDAAGRAGKIRKPGKGRPKGKVRGPAGKRPKVGAPAAGQWPGDRARMAAKAPFGDHGGKYTLGAERAAQGVSSGLSGPF